MPTNQLIHTPVYNYDDNLLCGWIQITTDPRWKHATIQWDIGTLDNHWATSRPIHDAETPHFQHLIDEFCVPGLKGVRWWIRSIRWGRIKVKNESVDTFLATFQPYWFKAIGTALKGVVK